MDKYVIKKFDQNFNIHRVALAINALIGEFEVSGLTEDEYNTMYHMVRMRNYPWYNGRERGICLIITHRFEKNSLFITFGEHRNSDSIFVDSWEAKEPFNSPTIEDFTDEAYQARKFFKYDEVYKASEYIRTLIANRLDFILESEIRGNVKNS